VDIFFSILAEWYYLPLFSKGGLGRIFPAQVPPLFQRGGWGRFNPPQSPFEKGGSYILPPPFLKEGWGGFFLLKFPLFSKEGAGGDLIPLSPPLPKGESESGK